MRRPESEKDAQWRLRFSQSVGKSENPWESSIFEIKKHRVGA
jgi:ribosomal protein L29